MIDDIVSFRDDPIERNVYMGYRKQKGKTKNLNIDYVTEKVKLRNALCPASYPTIQLPIYCIVQ